jgi:hypothetical protein
MDELELLQARLRNEERRREVLATHYHNALLYGVKLRDALEQIQHMVLAHERAFFIDDVGEQIDIAAALRESVEAALRIAHPEVAKPSPPGAEFFHGHPYPEYLHLPMKATDDYAPINTVEERDSCPPSK